MLHLETRVLGRSKAPLDRWSIPLPPGGDGSSESLTLRDLLTKVVRAEVVGFEERQRARRVVRVLTESHIQDGVRRGKVDSGGGKAGPPVDAEEAVAAALGGFEDGLYLVILDGHEQRDLDAQVYLTEESRLVFLRLTFLAGA